MPIPYKHKRSTAAGVAPSTLQDGEIAINVAASDPKLFYKDSSSTIRAFSLASYASASHTHVVADVTDFTTKANVVSVNGITGVVSISHTSVSAAAASHTHNAADVVSGTLNVARIPTIGYTALSGVPTTFAPSAHTHVAADITDFSSAVASASPEEVVEYLTTSVFPATGSTTLLYLATDASRAYRWTGSEYVEVGTSTLSASGSSGSVAGSRALTFLLR